MTIRTKNDQHVHLGAMVPTTVLTIYIPECVDELLDINSEDQMAS